MEPGQRDHIEKNLPDLLKNTSCTHILLAYLLQDKLISQEDIYLLKAQATPTGKAAKLYEIIVTRSKSYNGLQRALEKTCQRGALDILNKYTCIEIDPEVPPEAIKEASIWNPVLLQNPRNVSHLAEQLQEPRPQTKPEESVLQNIPGLDKDINILLLGETGVGKSTWINSFSTMLKYSSLAEAEDGNLVTLIPSEFTVFDEDFHEIQINTGTDKNEVWLHGQSATQEARVYPFKIGKATIRLIDTPGITDTLGIEQDKKNFQNILSTLSQLKEIHGICILLKPHNSRLIVMFRWCIQELLTYLHRDATKNIMFCFTNSRGTFYRPGDTMPALKKLLNEKNVGIKVNQNTVYCFDSEAYRFLAAIKNHPKVTFPDDERANFTQSWEKSIAETKRMLGNILELSPHQIQSTLNLNHARELVLKMVRPMADITRSTQINKAIVEDEKRDILRTHASIQELEMKIMTTRTEIETRPVAYAKTVCLNTKCAKIFTVKGGYVPHNETICHAPCHCINGVAKGFIGDQLLGCVTISNGICKVGTCGHSYREHIHVYYDSVQVVKQVEDQAVIESIKKNMDAAELKQRMINNRNRLIHEYEHELKEIETAAVTFGYFLKVNAIIPYNDEVEQYLNHLIYEEETKGWEVRDKKGLEYLKESKRSYLMEKEILEKQMRKGCGPPPSGEIANKMAEKLKTLKHSGDMLRQALDCMNYTAFRT